MRNALLGMVVLSGALGAAGCNDGPAPIELDELTVRVGGAYCSYAMRCGTTSVFEQYLLHSTLQNCASQTGTYLANTQFARYQEAIDRGTITYDADSAGRCLAAFDALGCGPSALSGAPAGCDDTFHGTVADGGACTISEECSANSTCAGATSGCGVCTHTPQLGESCTTSCGDGAFCHGGTCTAVIAAGGACTPSENGCDEGLRCDAPESDPTHGTCATPTRATAGQPCGTVGCDTGLVCAFSGTAATCRAPRTDGTCQGLISGTDCAAGTTCNADIGMTGMCVPYPSLGQACTTTCASPARCVNDVCHPSGELGQTCETSDDCLSGFCDASTCAPQPLCNP